MKITKYWQKGLRIGIIIFVIGIIGLVILQQNDYSGYCPASASPSLAVKTCSRLGYFLEGISPQTVAYGLSFLVIVTFPTTLVGLILDKIKDANLKKS